jgi:signal transduction histidine kinase
MYAESIEENRQLCPPAPKMKSMKGSGQAFCAVACEQADGSVARGEAACASQSELRRVSAQLLTIQESERQRIATDLHDGLGQSLTLIKLALEDVTGLLAANALSEAETSLQQLKTKVQDAFGELRRVAMDLRPSTLDDLGILATLSWFFRDFEGACRGIKIEKHLLVQESNIPVPLKITIFRILQEAVSNIVKHAKADHIRVSIKKAGDALHLSIEDDGEGFDPAGLDNYCPLDKGLGLVSMKERAEFSGGTYQIESAIGQGTRISVSWPCA